MFTSLACIPFSDELSVVYFINLSDGCKLLVNYYVIWGKTRRIRCAIHILHPLLCITGTHRCSRSVVFIRRVNRRRTVKIKITWATLLCSLCYATFANFVTSKTIYTSKNIYKWHLEILWQAEFTAGLTDNSGPRVPPVTIKFQHRVIYSDHYETASKLRPVTLPPMTYTSKKWVNAIIQVNSILMHFDEYMT